MYIGLSGKAGSGKDTVYGMILDMLASADPDSPTVYNMKFAAHLKQMAADMLGVPASNFESQEFKAQVIPTSEEGMTNRDFLLELGTGLMRKVDSHYWIKRAFRDCHYSDEDYYIFTDTRFLNEANAIRERGGVIIRVNMFGNEGVDHISDKALDDYKFDFEINSVKGDLEQLRKQVAIILQQITDSIK